MAFFHGSSVASWNTRPMMRRFAASCGAMPSTDTLPSVGTMRPASTFNSVLLPHPDGPISETKLPFGTDKIDALQHALAAALQIEIDRDVAGIDLRGRGGSWPPRRRGVKACTHGERGASSIRPASACRR